MIVVKTKCTLRVNENGKKRLIPAGAKFQGRTIKDLPEWLQEHIAYFRKTPRCTTLIINETVEPAVIDTPIAPKAPEKIKRVAREVKKVEEEKKIDPPPPEEGLGFPDPKIIPPDEVVKDGDVNPEPVLVKKEEPKKVIGIPAVKGKGSPRLRKLKK